MARSIRTRTATEASGNVRATFRYRHHRAVHLRLRVNTKPANGFIDVWKIVTNVNGDQTAFHFTYANPTTDVSTTDDNHTGAQNALAGAHTVTEPSVDGYTTLGWKVVNGLGDTNNCGSAPSEAVTSNNGGVGDAGLDNTAEVTVAGNSTRVIASTTGSTTATSPS